MHVLKTNPEVCDLNWITYKNNEVYVTHGT